MKPVVGKTYRINYGEGNLNNKTFHTLSIVDGDMVVFKWWSRNKQRWFYGIEPFYFFELRNDIIKQVR